MKKEESEMYNLFGYEPCAHMTLKRDSPKKVLAKKIESTIDSINAFYASTTAVNSGKMQYITTPQGHKKRYYRRFKDGKEVTKEHIRSVILKECEDRCLPFEHILKIGGWTC